MLCDGALKKAPKWIVRVQAAVQLNHLILRQQGEEGKAGERLYALHYNGRHVFVVTRFVYF